MFIFLEATSHFFKLILTSMIGKYDKLDYTDNETATPVSRRKSSRAGGLS